ncbi:hypothetical protein PIROE2DRAFT_16696 [Piromyces sp. E2]|nr:hypothetical protein PIROE2DRAFT_16696 [Piromyces sp. E2]|eukprot:OUM58115.1 hypothetical protein PIROE2DRAFT_16696 [Piromyces sp. E2]
MIVIFLFVLLLVNDIFSYEIKIKNDEESMENFVSIINEISKTFLYEEIKIILEDEYYYIPHKGRNIFNIQSNVIFYSEKGSVFDFQNTDKGEISFLFNSQAQDKKLIFKNITFCNYYNIEKMAYLLYFKISLAYDNYRIEFDNCTFKNNRGLILNFSHTCIKSIQSEPQVYFNNCTFINLDKVFAAYHEEDYYDTVKSPKCFFSYYKNCYFENIKYIGKNQCGSVTFDDCYFRNIYGNEQYECLFVYSISHGNEIKMVNSRIEDIDIKINQYLFYLSNTYLELSNTTFKNCHSNNGYLIYSKSTRINELIQLNVNESVFEDGHFLNVSIKNSKFHDIKSKSSIPLLIDSHNSNLFFDNVEINNIISSSTLFNEESSYYFDNVKFSDIITNSKSMINTIYNSLSFNNCTFINIICNGDVEDSSLIKFTSIDNTYNLLNFNNVIVEECKSNGDFIIIDGDKSLINIENFMIHNITSYGSLLNIMSSNSKVNINNAYINNNLNDNKYKCGLISNYNDIIFDIQNTTIKNNIVKSNGGVLCFMNNNILNLKIESSLFENNYSSNGGVIYINNKSNTIYNDNYGNLDNDNNVEIVDTSFINNNVEFFGGVIYSDYDNLNISNLKNTSFIKNNAYAGGAIYINNNNDAVIFNKLKNNNEVNFINNTSISHGNDFATGPNLIKLKDQNINKFTVKSGESLSLNYILIDSYNQTIEDNYKYYSNIILHVNIKEDINDIEIQNTIINGNECLFSNGICELKNLKIYSEYPINLKLILDLENKNINISNEDIDIVIRDCDNNQIKMFTKNYLYYCEDPICNDDCPISNGTAICKKGSLENINSVQFNLCNCIPGYIGNNCQEKDYLKLKYIL